MSEPPPQQDPERHGLRPIIGLFAGPAVFAAFLIAPAPAGLTDEAWRVAAVVALMAIWWVTEAIPIPATALLPLALFPTLDIETIGPTAAPYANPIIFLFMGGFMIARAMQRWELHRRVALRIVRLVGTEPRRMIMGFMIACAFISMWVSNTATTVMMLPIAASVIQLVLRGEGRGRDPEESNFALALLLGIAYSASIGGIATLIGTPPNALFAGFMNQSFGIKIGFAQWMLVGLPVTLVMLPVAWFVLTRWVFPIRIRRLHGGMDAIHQAIEEQGPISKGEVRVAIVFILVAITWMLRPALSPWMPNLSDAGIAILGALLLFAIPVDLKKGVFVLDWESAARLPWDVLVLFGGGLSLAGAIRKHGLADWLGQSMAGLDALPLLAIMLVVATSLIFITELTSNTASASAFLPVLAALAIGIGENPYYLLVPAVLAASCAFMMPVATPPNAIVFGTGLVTIPKMVRAGIVLNLLFALVIPLMAYVLVAWVFGAQPGAVPAWTQP